MISVVMAYYNRKLQLDYTLKTIRQSRVRDVEIVIVDDFSDDQNHLRDLAQQWPDLTIRVISLRDHFGQKKWCNPCVPYNIGLRACQGEFVVIQNPECCHMGDVLAHVEAHCSDGVYLSFHTYGCTKQDTQALHATGHFEMFSHAKKARWYNHEVERPVAFHFCNAITRTDLKKVNGFDERFALGHNWDDAELLHRVRKICTVKFVSDPWAVHQYHTKSYQHPDNPMPTQDNKALYFQTVDENIIRAPNQESIT